MKLAIVIMAHPKRKEWAEELAAKLDAPIVYDQKNNVWDTCRRAWLSQLESGAEYVLVLQDDTIIGDNFRERAAELIERHEKAGDFIYSFYAGEMLATRIDAAIRKGNDHIIAGAIFNEVALCMKREHITRMVKWSDERNAQTDQEIGRWARLARLTILYPIPSIVDHRTGESLYRKHYNKPLPDKERKAYIYKPTV